MRSAPTTGLSVFTAAALLTALTALFLVSAVPVEEGPSRPGVSHVPASAPTGTREAPEIRFLMDSYTTNATVEPGETGMVMFQGILRVNTSGMYRDDEYFRIDLKAEIEEEWATMVTPSTVILGVGQNATVNITCRVPPAVSSSITGVIALGGTCTPFSSSMSHMIPPVFLHITADEYYRFSVESGIPYLKWNGETAKFMVKINNEGNGEEMYHIELVNRNSLEDDALEVDLSTTSLIVGERESESFTVRVGISHSTPNELYPIHLRFTSLGATGEDGERYGDFNLHLRVTSYGPGWVQRMIYPHLTECLAILVLLAVFITALVMTVRKRRRLVREWAMKLGEMDEPAKGRRGRKKLTHRSDVQHRRVQTHKARMPPRQRY